MNSKQLVILACGVMLATVGVVAGVQVVRQHVTTSQASTQEATQQATQAALIQQIAQIEVDHLLLSARYTENSPQLVRLRVAQRRLKQQLQELGADHSEELEGAIATAVETKIVELEIQYAKDQTRYLESHPVLQVQQEQLLVLRQRLASF